jgi:hypothetical protein
MRQMELELGQEAKESDPVLELQWPLREEVVALVAEAIVAVIRSVKERESGDESSVQP